LQRAVIWHCPRAGNEPVAAAVVRHA
jgi:hypothetical protein